MKIVVFGGTGFIGGRAVELLQAAGHEVIVVTSKPERASAPGYRFGDHQRVDTLGPAVEGAEVVIQSTTFPGYPIEKPGQGMTFMAYDGEGTERIVAAAEAAGVRRYVYVSGVGVEADSDKPYYQAIHRAETAVLGSSMESASVRPAFVYGPRDAGLNRILGWAKYTPILPVPGMGSMHQPVFIDDVAQALAALVEPGAPQGVFESGGPERMTMGEMLRRTFAFTGTRCTPVALPKPLARFSGRFLQHLPGALLSPAAVDFICEQFVADNRRVSEELGVTATGFEDGLGTYLSR